MKKRELRELIEKERVDFVCIQEIKKDTIDKKMVEMIWRHGNVDWVYVGAMGKSGGLLCIWNKDCFEKSNFWGEEGVLGVRGKWKGKEVEKLNVYAPCRDLKKEDLWGVMKEKLI